MLKWWLQRQVRVFAANPRYDVAYQMDLIESDARAGLSVAAQSVVAQYRANAPATAWAKIVALRHALGHGESSRRVDAGGIAIAAETLAHA